MRKPSPAMLVALLALFVALGGAGVAATGGNFILGQSNTADKTTALSVSSLPSATNCPAPCQALQVTDNSTAMNAGGLGVLGKSASTPAATIANTGGATALNLLVNPGKPPFSVNSDTKVAKLNADKLDGIDSAGLVRGRGAVYGDATAIAQATDGSTRTHVPSPAVVPGIVNIEIECPPTSDTNSTPAMIWVRNLTGNQMYLSIRNTLYVAPIPTVAFVGFERHSIQVRKLGDMTDLTIWGATEKQQVLTQATVTTSLLLEVCHSFIHAVTATL